MPRTPVTMREGPPASPSVVRPAQGGSQEPRDRGGPDGEALATLAPAVPHPAPPDLPPDPDPLHDVPRLLGRIDGERPGPMLVCFGGVHGNEPGGVLGLQRVLAVLETRPEVVRGNLVALCGNRGALARARRFVREDLNRVWTEERVARVREHPSALQDEDAELRDLDRALAEIIPDARGRVVFLDLHSTSGGGAPFSVLDDTLANRSLARLLPVPCVLGLEEELAGTLLGYLNRQGYAAVGFECGQHAAPGTVDRAEAAVWIVLEGSGVLEPGSCPEVERSRRRLEADTAGMPVMVEVRDRHHIPLGSRFAMRPGYGNFQRLTQGELLAEQDGSPVHAEREGLILMPLYQAQGQDGFFVVRPVAMFWLWLSRVARRLHGERFLHWLPGVARRGGRHVVDLRRARWLARQMFHLLGFRRVKRDGHTVVMERRVDAPPEGGTYGPWPDA